MELIQNHRSPLFAVAVAAVVFDGYSMIESVDAYIVALYHYWKPQILTFVQYGSECFAVYSVNSSRRKLSCAVGDDEKSFVVALWMSIELVYLIELEKLGGDAESFGVDDGDLDRLAVEGDVKNYLCTYCYLQSLPIDQLERQREGKHSQSKVKFRSVP